LDRHSVKPGEFSFTIENRQYIHPFIEELKKLSEDAREMGVRLILFDDLDWDSIEREFYLAQFISALAISIMVLAMITAVALVVYLLIVRRIVFEAAGSISDWLRRPLQSGG